MSNPNEPAVNGGGTGADDVASGLTTNQLIGIIAGVVAFILLIALCKCFTAGGKNKYAPDLSGKVIIVTGSNTGIGLTAALEMAKLGPKTIVMACRSQTRALAAIATIQEKLSTTSTTQLEFIKLDLADLDSVKEFANEIKAKYPRVDMLVNNAGLLVQQKEMTKQNHELMFGTNHLGHFLLTKLLLENLKASDEGRIVNLSSDAHKMCKGQIDVDDLNSDNAKFEGFPIYAKSKFMNILYTKQLDMELKSQGITNVKTTSVHPGVVRTEFSRNFFQGKPLMKAFCYICCCPCCCPILFLCLKSPLQGAQTTLHCCLLEYKELSSGAYYKDCHLEKEQLNDNWKDQAQKLWDQSQELTASYQ